MANKAVITVLPVQANNIPVELKRLKHWVCWRLDARDGKATKVPYHPDGYRASVTNPDTWSSFPTVFKAYQADGFEGVGFVFSQEDPYTGVDLDKCRDSETGALEVWAREVIDSLGGYTELSPSGTGVHIIVKAKLPEGGHRKGHVELYESGRYFTVTGALMEGN
jgi:putative DNA primase/helicase